MVSARPISQSCRVVAGAEQAVCVPAEADVEANRYDLPVNANRQISEC